MGHAVSHAKNRVKRLFRPNLQKLRVLKNGILVGVKLCTRCIRRLCKDKTLGNFSFSRLRPSVVLPAPVKIAKEDKIQKEKETLKIEEIVGRPGK